MTKKPGPKDKSTKLRPDANEIAFRVLKEATGESPKTVPGEGPKNPEAVKRGAKGGKARATLPDSELSRIGRTGGRPRK